VGSNGGQSKRNPDGKNKRRKRRKRRKERNERKRNRKEKKKMIEVKRVAEEWEIQNEKEEVA